ncbi:MAG: DUF456 domain-containing protein [Paludibacteraceae bacterium]|nr:DUF456 domain-containing protein [Paludibacteraceae bacterium]MBQ2190059.1 DUF456 domain-containing protein [Paludibacteraceae bacterium]
METNLLILAGICLLVGLIGSIFPGLPGLLLAYIGLWIAQATDRVDFSWQMLLIWGIIAVSITIFDYAIPLWETKRKGESPYRYYGSMLGIQIGLFIGMIGMIALGTKILDWIGKNITADEPNLGFTGCLGMMIGNIIKIVCCTWMTVSFAQAVW